MTAEQIFDTHLLTLNAKDMEGKWLGPVPIEKWLNDFRPTNRKQRRENLRLSKQMERRISFNTFKTTVNAETKFANVINESGVMKDRGLWCRETRDIFGRDIITDADHTLKFAPCISFIGNKDLEMELGNEERLEHLLGDVLFFGDVKDKNSQDLCLDLTSAEDRELILSEELDNDAEELFVSRGQFACYARAICANSHRTHLYAFVILPDFARLLYFDRSGVAYSSLFDWKNTDILGEFIESFAEATPLQRGIDTSVTKISAQDDLVDKAQTIFTEAYDAGDELPDGITWDSVFRSHASKYTTYWLCNVYDEASKSFHRVLTHRAHTSSPYFSGRATRGYIGVDIDEGVVAYMKRNWRIDGAAFPKEIDIYCSFATPTKEGKTVPHLPGCYFGGDVPRGSDELAAHYFKWKETSKPGETWTPPSLIESTKTRTSKYADDVKDSHPKIRRGVSALGRAELIKTHTEMAPYTLTVTLFKKIGSKLRDFKSTRDLCVALRDALETHEAALELKNVLHRDISDGNILIAKVKGEKGKVEGLLIDWDLCINIQKFGASRRKGRTGTRAFMSARMLEQPRGFVHDAFDDLESFCHVFHSLIFRFRHTIPINESRKADLWDAMGRIFDPDGNDMTAKRVANEKRNFLRGGVEVMNRAGSVTQPSQLKDIMLDLLRPLGQYYRQPPTPLTEVQSRNPEVKEDYDAEVTEHKRKVARGYTRCTHEYFLKCFNYRIVRDMSWAKDGPAQDQYPPHIRKAKAQDKDIDLFYRETEGGISISTPSKVARAPSRRLFPDIDFEDVFGSRFYAAGSDRTSSAYTTDAADDSDSDGVDAVDVVDAAAANETQERPRKRQRMG